MLFHLYDETELIGSLIDSDININANKMIMVFVCW